MTNILVLLIETVLAVNYVHSGDALWSAFCAAMAGAAGAWALRDALDQRRRKP